EPDLVEELQPAADIDQQPVADLLALAIELDLIDETPGFAQAQRGHLADVLPGDLDVEGFLAEPPAPAVRALGVAAVARQHDADAHLVFFRFEVSEEARHAGEALAAFEHE